MHMRVGNPTNLSTMLLTPLLTLAPFEKWGVDFGGPINPPNSHGNINKYCISGHRLCH